ncbi:MATE family efflux transporter [bacterium]|nr:MATE family efflux transporter [bacterium]
MLKKYLIELLSIASPMVIGNLGHVLTGATDVFVAAKHGIDTLAAMAIANSIFFTLFIIGLGFLSGISIVLSNYRGEHKPTKKFFLSGIVLSQILALITWFFIYYIIVLIPKFGFEGQLCFLIQDYMFITSFSIFGIFLYQAIKEFLQAHEIVQLPNYILLLAVILNLILNFLFVFGYGFIPPMGIEGLAYATLLVRTILGLSMIIYTFKIIKNQRKNCFNKAYIKEVIKIGFPIGIGLLFECLGFNIITIAIGRESGTLAAAQNILLTLIDITFMIPFAISSAIAIKVGFYNGEKNMLEIKKYSQIGVLMSILFMSSCSLIFIFMPELFIGIFTKDIQITKIALPVVPLFALYEIADGMQISLGGVLKGLKMTKQVTLSVLSSYWLIGIPLGFYLAYCFKMSLKGFWFGLTASLFIIALLEGIILFKAINKLKKSFQ